MTFSIDGKQVRQYSNVPFKLGACTLALGLMSEKDIAPGKGSVSCHGQGAVGKWGNIRISTTARCLTVKTVLASIVLVVVVSWIYLLTGAGMPKMDMGGGQVMLMPPPSWSVSYAAIIFAMWTIMMVAMMLPSAAPTILRIAGRAEGVAPAAFFTAGYLIVWTGFSAVATTLQWAFDSAHLLSDSMAIRSELAASFIVIGVGLYQLSAVKKNCLRRCCSTHFLPDDQVRSASAEVRAGVTYGIRVLAVAGL